MIEKLSDVETWNKDTMPKLIQPFDITRKNPTKYLGGRYIKSDIILKINYIAESQEEVAQLVDFWQTGCYYGTKVFALELPLVGLESNGDIFIYSFYSDLKLNSNNIYNTKGSLDLRLEYKLDVFDDFKEI